MNVVVHIPVWVRSVTDIALRVAAENAYSGLAFATAAGADTSPKCARLMATAREQLKRLEDETLPLPQRVEAAQTAAVNFGAARMLLTDTGTPPRT